MAEEKATFLCFDPKDQSVIKVVRPGEVRYRATAKKPESMLVLRTVAEMRAIRDSLEPDRTIGFVPTMGGLHAGHEALIIASRKASDTSIVSLFVNPEQFAAGEDLSTYPRTEAADLELCASAGTDVVFAPTETEVYPATFGTYVTTACGQPDRNERSEGASRPTFFRGVATVLAKLFILVRPTASYFGQKDAQQCAVVRQLVRDLWLPMRIVVVPTVRESDGLAMSSRNVYLTEAERQHAGMLYRALRAAQAAARGGERDAERLRGVVRRSVEEAVIGSCGVGFELAYVSVCDRDTMEEVDGDIGEDERCLACVAGMMGKARLLDNVVINGGS